MGELRLSGKTWALFKHSVWMEKGDRAVEEGEDTTALPNIGSVT